MGDGELNEGSVWEAAMSASKHQLSNLSVLIDYNKMQSYGSTREIMNLEPLADKLKSFGFAIREVDGHEVSLLEHQVKLLPFDNTKPSALICHTIKGKGFPFAEGKPEWHHKSGLSDTDIQMLYDNIQ